MRTVLIAAVFLTCGSAAAQSGDAGETASAYPPCSARVTDRCIQLQDVSTAEHASAFEIPQGAGGPFEPVDDPVEDHATALNEYRGDYRNFTAPQRDQAAVNAISEPKTSQ